MKKYIASLLACVIAVCAFAPFSASADGTYAGEHFDVPQIRVTTKDGVGNTLENTQAAESLIRDTDMAKEYSTFSAHNILEQAGQAMLSQANQANQGVLSLLQ